MGWTGQQATHFKNGKIIDRKAECDAYFMEGPNKGYFQVVKSAMIGSTYYAAVKDLKRYVGEDSNGHDIVIPIDGGETWGYVFLTSVKGGMFYYKNMSEDMGPYAYDCPESILKLLSDTESKSAIEWRNRCREKLEKKKTHNLSKLPIGTKIIWTRKDGVEVELLKHAPAYQFKRPFWFNAADRTYMSAKWIVDWEVKAN